jgi:hypothetical protein
MKSISTLINLCRICKGKNLELILDFGPMSLTGLFLNSNEEVPKAPLTLVQCSYCGLVQLNHSYQKSILYGSNYGYESHLNSSMVSHLHAKARILSKKFLNQGDIIVDVASNDGTFLSVFDDISITKVAIDPIINNLSNFYPKETIKISDFFSSEVYWSKLNKPAKLVSSLSVLYDLENPIKFAEDIFNILEDNGIWHLEQSYLPSMLSNTSYDTVCHEHLLYLKLHDIKTILENSGFTIIDVTLNDINGGSIAVTAIKNKKLLLKENPYVNFLLNQEVSDGLIIGESLNSFIEKVHRHKIQLRELIENYKQLDFEIYGLGASTKGNVILQWAGLDSSLIKSIGEINPRKFNKVTPGSNIKIVNELEILEKIPKKSGIVSLVLPWHFRSSISKRSEKYLSNGGKLLFPLPKIESIGTL